MTRTFSLSIAAALASLLVVGIAEARTVDHRSPAGGRVVDHRQPSGQGYTRPSASLPQPVGRPGYRPPSAGLPAPSGGTATRPPVVRPPHGPQRPHHGHRHRHRWSVARIAPAYGECGWIVQRRFDRVAGVMRRVRVYLCA
jgi:hypothetical protein